MVIGISGMTKKLYYKQNNSWIDTTGFYHRVSGAWEPALDVYYKDGGVWKQGYEGTAPITSVSASNVSGSEENSDANWPTSVSASNPAPVVTPPDDGSYNYLYEHVSGDAMVITGSGASRTFSRSMNPPFDDQEVKTATIRVTVSNSVSSQEDTFTVTLTAINSGAG